MTELRKAAERALEALEAHADIGIKSDKQIEALRQALAQPEQEPVAWVLHRELFWSSEYAVISEDGDNAIPLYTAPPKKKWVGLTDKEITKAGDLDLDSTWGWYDFARAIEAKLKEKNNG